MVNWDELKEGEVGTSMTIGPLERSEFKVYADTGGDSNPIHQDEFAGLVNKRSRFLFSRVVRNHVNELGRCR